MGDTSPLIPALLRAAKMEQAQPNTSEDYVHHWRYYEEAFLRTSGRCFPVDLQQARQLFLRAAAQGNVPSLVALGKIYLQGAGVPADKERAMKYFKAAASTGNAEAKMMLGQLVASA